MGIFAHVVDVLVFADSKLRHSGEAFMAFPFFIAFRIAFCRTLVVTNRNIIPNDTKLFAQADCEKAIEFYLSSDSESLKIYNLLRLETAPKFQFIDLNTPYNETFGLLDL